MSGPYLQVGTSSTSNVLDFSDQTNYAWFAQSLSLGGSSIPGGITFVQPSVDPLKPDHKPPPGAIAIQMGLLCQGSTLNVVEANIRAITANLWRAEKADSALPHSLPVVFLWQPPGQSAASYFDVRGGWVLPVATGQPWQALNYPVLLQMWVYPESRGVPDTTGANKNGTALSAFYYPAIAGDVPALARFLLTDTSSGGVFIQRIRASVRTADPMSNGDFTPYYAIAPASPGAAHVNAAAYGGTEARLASGSITTALQQFGAVTGANGAHDRGHFDAYLKVKDAGTPLVGPTWPATSAVTGSGTGGNLSEGQYLVCMTTKDAGGNESFPSAVQAVTVPVTTTPFFDSGEGGDLSQWANTAFSFAGSGNQGSVNVTSAAAYDTGIPGDDLGFRALSGLGANGNAAYSGGAWAYTQIPGGGNTGAIRARLRINSVSGTAGQRVILAVDSSHNPLFWLKSTGTDGWSLAYFATSAGGFERVIALAQIPQGDWVRFELRITAWNAGTSHATLTFYVNDQAIAALTANTSIDPINAPWGFAIGAETVGTATDTNASALSVDFDDVQISNAAIGANTGSIVANWNAGLNGNGYYLYAQKLGAAWRQNTIGSLATVTSTITSNTAGSIVSPPTATPVVQPALVQLQYAVAGTSPTWAAAPAVSLSPLVGGQYAYQRIAQGIPLPPAAPFQDGSVRNWQLKLLGAKGGTTAANLDSDVLMLFPSGEDGCVITAPGGTLAALGQWQIDINQYGYVSCDIYTANGATLIMQAAVSGQLSVGPHDTILAITVETADANGNFIGDIADLTYTIKLASLTPRYKHLAGAG